MISRFNSLFICNHLMILGLIFVYMWFGEMGSMAHVVNALIEIDPCSLNDMISCGLCIF